MEDEGLEDWDDAAFVEELIQVQERVISDSQPPLKPEPPPSSSITYSPPRHLSQRSNAVSSSSALPPRVWTSQRLDKNPEIGRLKMAAASSSSALPPCVSGNSGCDKEHEIGRLKMELGHVLKQLSDYEQECSELKKERDKKDEQLQFVLSRNEKKDGAARNSDSANLESSVQLQMARGSSHQPSSQVHIGESTSKATGVQTDETSASAQAIHNDDQHISDNLSKKLLAIWGSPNEQELGKNVISNLLMACQTDFHSLSGCIGMNISSKLRMDTAGDEGSCIAASQNMHISRNPEVAKVSHLYSVLTKVNNGMMKLDALFQPLVDLCSLKNVVIVQASLHILHVFLKHLLSLERQVEGRVNVMVEGLVRRNQTSYVDSLPFGMDFYAETESKSGDWNNGVANLVSRVDWVSLSELIIQTAMRNTEHSLRLQAVSIMNVIVMKSNAFMEREMFGRTLVFEMIAKLLAKEAGFEVRKQAVQLLYMLLNCPKILVKFCSGYKEEMDAGAMDENAEDALTFQKYCMILQGLADCLACCGHCLEELILCRNAVLLLAFLASSGISGFEILASHKLLQDANFLMLILQVLAAEADQTAVNTKQQHQLYKERTLLVREALILLNRLASNPSYSATVLHVLTNSRDMASLAIDVASRLSRKDQIYEKFECRPESDVGDLARVFKKRVFTYLGDNIF
ncbi:protein SENSITIVE TO UV 2 isoform X1 [Rosa chinensis]|uniref:protein SENSITIVE TO UV 2 isoform X1 n=1 Tax=Rosa chinensis TaxID=74649 RepID=UPI000D0970ED|nr:protein SENSITIVE TO UV 2 isoform X1 [Rosa chinensis]